jgi:hypothetical protein
MGQRVQGNSAAPPIHRSHLTRDPPREADQSAGASPPRMVAMAWAEGRLRSILRTYFGAHMGLGNAMKPR